MNYEEKYKQAIERMKSWVRGEHPECFCEAQKAAEFIFPELAESEDERIREDLIQWINDILAWLEKQGEHKPTDNKEKLDVLKFIRKETGCGLAEANNALLNLIKVLKEHPLPIMDKPRKLKISWEEPELVESEDEQNSAEDVKPKFKVGDWIVFNGQVLYINEIVNGYYRTVSIGDIPCSYDWAIDNIARLWTINDAKDGDVLVAPPEEGSESNEQIFLFKAINSRDYVDNCIEYYGRLCDGSFYKNKTGYMGTTLDTFYPATKEQRDMFFEAMKEAGYEWDGEKKELKK